MKEFFSLLLELITCLAFIGAFVYLGLFYELVPV